MSLLLLTSVSGLVYWDYSSYLDSPVATGEAREINVVIPRGTTFSQVVKILKDKGLIVSPSWFKLYLIINEMAPTLKAGAYYFNTGMTPREIADMLSQGPRTPYVVLTIKEGFNIWQVAAAFESAGLADEEDVLDLLVDPELAAEAGIPQGPMPDNVISPVEGFIFPETYFIAPGQSVRSILLRMIRQSLNELKQVKKNNIAQYSVMLERVGLTDYEIVTLASLVERETPLEHEKKLVASVFLNRLAAQMRLETDPTLTYSRERRGAKPTVEDKKNEANPYNTYARAGLPPGPICNPGRDALAAAVATPRTGFLYFVAKQDGSSGHHFTTNYPDHERAVQQYLKKKK